MIPDTKRMSVSIVLSLWPVKANRMPVLSKKERITTKC